MRTRFFTAAIVLALAIATTGCKVTPRNDAAPEAATTPSSQEATERSPGLEETESEAPVPEHEDFIAADSDGDGMLTTMEFVKVWKGGEVTLYDTNGDGFVSPREFDDYVTTHP